MTPRPPDILNQIAATEALELEAARKPELWHKAARTWQKIGDVVRADAAYRHALTVETDVVAEGDVIEGLLDPHPAVSDYANFLQVNFGARAALEMLTNEARRSPTLLISAAQLASAIPDVITAERLYFAAIDLDVTGSRDSYAGYLFDRGERDGAIEVLQMGIDLGERSLLISLAQMHHQCGNLVEAEMTFCQALEQRVPKSHSAYAWFLEIYGQIGAAIDIRYRGLEAGEISVLPPLASLLVREGRTLEAEALFLREGADPGLYTNFMKETDPLAAEHLIAKKVLSGQETMFFELAELQQSFGNLDQAEMYFRWHAQVNGTFYSLIAFLRSQGRDEEAEHFIHEGIADGATNLWNTAVDFYKDTGRREEAEFSYGMIVDDYGWRYPCYAQEFVENGDVEGAVRVLQQGIAGGVWQLNKKLGDLYAAHDDTEAALRHYIAGSEAGDRDCHASVATIYQNGGDHERAAHWFERSAISGYGNMWSSAGYEREQVGDVVGAEADYVSGRRCRDVVSTTHQVNLLLGRGDTSGAERVLYQDASWSATCYVDLGKLLVKQGDSRGARRMLQMASANGIDVSGVSIPDGGVEL